MKRLQLLSLFFLILISMHGFTQNDNPQKAFNKSTHRAVGQKEVAGMKKELNLTAAQASELEEAEHRLHTAFFAPAKDSADMVARKQKLEKLQRDKEEVFQKILTPGQWKTYQAYMEEKRKRARAEIEERRRKAGAASSGNEG